MSHEQTSIYGPLIEIAENAVRHWAGDVDRAEAARVLDKWKFAAALSDAERVAVLDRFRHDPDPVAYRDYLPEDLGEHPPLRASPSCIGMYPPTSGG